MIQQSLFRLQPLEPDICRHRHQGADTSRLANARVQKSADRDAVLWWLKQFPAGLTLDEVAGHMGRQVNTISGRFTELRKAGQIVDTGYRRPTQTGSLARVYKETP